MTLDLATIAFNAMSWAMATFLVASGLTLVFGVLHILNFAHGGFFLLGAYMLFSIAQAFGGELPVVLYVLACLGIAVVIALLGIVANALVFERLRHVDDAYVLIATYALLLFVEGVAKLIWGIDSLSVMPPSDLLGAVFAGSLVMPHYSIFLIVSGVIVFVSLEWMMVKTAFGRMLQAVAIDPWMCGLLSVNVDRIRALTIVIGFGLAGLAGGLLAANQGLDPRAGGAFIIQAFGVIIIGGMGSIRGAFFAALILGFMEAIGLVLLPQFPGIFFYITLAGMLLVRPRGLISRGAVA
ncbi:branched-chain amino acid ABC transporter permease [Aminobacter aminovorans]|uniref:ABC branched chain amino acid transporter, inner membrane subunit n=1 Tax=Aminobacter aminovorans TaxID=83263 RepID=A0AAC9FEU3_AMIAI|nr:branched-chain amino acid ABC transporter permease [Aminobacter aminovorans]AMS45510.1 ABC branched chain amino acid transporter, inner membrane subunit [Aminobacter aminovorans]MBB3708585.1 branched-chain amino acid transport system permease protein [Aminobacter aminovorans]